MKRLLLLIVFLPVFVHGQIELVYYRISDDGENSEMRKEFKTWDAYQTFAKQQLGPDYHLKISVTDSSGNPLTIVHKDKAVRCLSEQDGILYAGLKGRPGDAHVLKSEDDGKTWTFLNDGKPLALRAEDVQTITQSRTQPLLIVAGTWKNGLFISKNGGKSFKPVDDFPDKDIRQVGFGHQAQAGWETIFCATTQYALVLSTDGGEHWIGPDSLAMDSTFKSAWGAVPIPETRESFMLTFFKGIYRTTHGGRGWEKVLDLPQQICFDLDMSPQNTKEIWAVSQGEKQAYVHHSTDGGETWKTIESEHAFMQVEVVDVKGEAYPIFGGPESLYTYKEGAFAPLPLTLPFYAVSSLLAGDDYIIVGTWGNGMTTYPVKMKKLFK